MEPIIELSFLVLMLIMVLCAWRLGCSAGRSTALIETLQAGCCASQSNPNFWGLTGQPKALAYDWWSGV